MSAFSPSGASSNTTIEVGLKSNPAIFNLELTTSGTEYTQTLPSGTKSFLVRIRQSAKSELRYSSMSTEYLTLPAGTTYTEERIAGSSTLTLYLSSSKDGSIAEIVAWT